MPWKKFRHVFIAEFRITGIQPDQRHHHSRAVRQMEVVGPVAVSVKTAFGMIALLSGTASDKIASRWRCCLLHFCVNGHVN